MSAKEFLSASSDEFGTPDWLFNALHAEFQFDVDAAASDINRLLSDYHTKEKPAHERKSWNNARVFCNPPYSRGNVRDFFSLALATTKGETGALFWVLLIPTYTERSWYHDYRQFFEVRFIKQRVKFQGGAGHARGNHMLLIVRNQERLAWWSP